jgi:hypothetical protein
MNSVSCQVTQSTYKNSIAFIYMTKLLRKIEKALPNTAIAVKMKYLGTYIYIFIYLFIHTHIYIYLFIYLYTHTHIYITKDVNDLHKLQSTDERIEKSTKNIPYL